MFQALFFLLLLLLGAALFSIVSGFCIYPAVQKALFELFATGNDSGNDKAELINLRRLFVSKKLTLRRGRCALSGWLFLPAEQKMNPERILIFAPEGRAFSARDLGFFLKEGFLARAGGGGNLQSDLPAVFLPSPVELFKAGAFFSFGAKEAVALKAWLIFFSCAFSSSKVFFCGKGLGGLSALFATAKLSRCTAGKHGNFGGAVADSPPFSIAGIAKHIVGALFPRRIPRVLVYAGVRIASVFYGLGIGGRDTRRALKRLAALKKKRPDIVVDVEL